MVPWGRKSLLKDNTYSEDYNILRKKEIHGIPETYRETHLQ